MFKRISFPGNVRSLGDIRLVVGHYIITVPDYKVKMQRPRDVAIKMGFLVGSLVECEKSARNKFEGQGTVSGYNGGTVETPTLKVKIPNGETRSYSSNSIRLVKPVGNDSNDSQDDGPTFAQVKSELVRVSTVVVENDDGNLPVDGIKVDEDQKSREARAISEITKLLREFGINDKKVLLIPKGSEIIDLSD